MRKWFTEHRQTVQLIALLAVYGLVIFSIMIHRWWQGEVYFFDHGIFDGSIWKVAQGQWPTFDHIDIVGLNQLGDHFTPSIYLLVPIYWLTQAYEAMFGVMALLVVGTLYVFYRLARVKGLTHAQGQVLIIMMGLFVGWQNALIAGFHSELPALLTLSLALYFMETKRWRCFWVFMIITLGFKELFVGIMAALGLMLILRKEYKQGLGLIIFSTGYYLLTTQVVIPYFRGDKYGYEMPALSLINGVKDMFIPGVKIKTIWISLSSFGFLPLLSPTSWPLILQDWWIRFALGSTHAWDLGLHYSIMSTAYLGYGAIQGMRWLKDRLGVKIQTVGLWLLLLLTLGLQYKLGGPLNLVYNRDFYTHTASMQFLRDFSQAIPSADLVMVPNNIAPRLTHTHELMLLREDYWKWMPMVIALDVREGQSPNNYWPANLETLARRLERDPNYHVNAYSEEQLIYQKQDVIDLTWYKKFEKKRQD